MLKKSILILFTGILFLSVQFGLAQSLNHVQGDVIVKLKSGVEINDLIEQVKIRRNHVVQFSGSRAITSPMNIHVLRFDHNRYNSYAVIDMLYEYPEVEIAQFNHLIQKRSTIPNDSLFNLQWQYINTGQLTGGVLNADLDLELAWDIATGGTTANGDTIVVCVVDDGLNPNHLDFEDNVWINYEEIPNNSIDDDGNGFVDDYFGWDVEEQDGDPYTTASFDSHGTPVAGIIGAKGNNGKGVSGVNWNVKLMIVRNNSVSEADLVEAYGYPMIMRKRFNESNGQSGALVVATNSSFGLNMGQPSEAPLWCAMYDSMGVYGILSAGATANANFDIDVVGDLPTACPSEYLISVTNLDETDEKVQSAGYGLTTIDLGAYGENTFTVEVPNGYGGFGGTSGATPHVAGAIGLIYSAPCTLLANLTRSNPSLAAQFVRDAILNGVSANPSLEGRTVTGGRLNINNAMIEILLQCGPCPPLIGPTATNQTSSSITLQWTDNDSIVNAEIQYRKLGATDYSALIATGETATITGLESCTDYEFRLRGLCENDTAIYTNLPIIRTDGCCDEPVNIEAFVVLENSFSVRWGGPTAATDYRLRYRESGLTAWEEVLISDQFYTVTDVSPCTNYELQVQSICADSSSDFADQILISTPGCGGCLDLEYCDVIPGTTEFEFIQSFSLGDFSNHSGDDLGYGEYTNLTLPHYERERTYTMKMVPGLNDDVELNEHYLVWIDLDQNGIFQESEKLVDMVSGDTSGVTADITIPENAQLGYTRMRIGMRFTRDPEACPSNQIFGEYEDYCITIDRNSGIGVGPISEKARLIAYPNPFVSAVELSINDFSSARGKLTIISQSGKVVFKASIDLLDNNQRHLELSDSPSGVYILQFVSEDLSFRTTQKLLKI